MAAVSSAMLQAKPVERVTARSVLLGMLSIGGMAFYITHYGGALIKSYLPVAVLVPFLIWVLANTALKRLFPSLALSKTELLTILSMMWIVGNLPAIGWAQYNVSTTVGTTFYASPENRLGDFAVPVLPKWLFLQAEDPTIHQAFPGLEQGQSIPWLQWLRPQLWWLVGGIFMWNIVGYWWDDYPRITLFGGARSKALDLGKILPPLLLPRSTDDHGAVVPVPSRHSVQLLGIPHRGDWA